MSDSEFSDVATRTPQQQGQSQSQSQPQPQSQSQPGSRPRKPISPPPLSRQATDSLQSDVTSITAAPPSHLIVPERDNGSAAAKSSSISVKPLFKSAHNPQSSTPPSAKKQADPHKTPKNQTPKKAELSAEKLEESLRRFAQDIGADTAKLTASLIQSSWKRKVPQRRFVSTRDCFSGVRLIPSDATAKSSDTMRIKTKVCFSKNGPILIQVTCTTNYHLASRSRQIWKARKAG